jgi:hypothetical protein
MRLAGRVSKHLMSMLMARANVHTMRVGHALRFTRLTSSFHYVNDIVKVIVACNLRMSVGE